MDFQNFRQLYLNGELLNATQLEAKAKDTLASKRAAEWEASLWQFILNWIGDEDFIQIQTSGSTGKPKTIRHSKKHMLNSAKMTCDYFSLNEESTALLCLSPQYIGGMMMVVRAFYSGMQLKAVEPQSYPLEGIKSSFDFAAMVPMQVQTIMDVSAKSLNQIDKLIIGGAVVSPKLKEQLQKVDTQCYSTFGMTETISHIALQRLNGMEISDSFEVLPNVAIEVDERGCLVIDAHHLHEGQIITNDLVEIIDAKHFKWLGRYDNVINTGGVKVYPEVIEGKLSGLIPNRYFITSIPHELFGEQVVLVIEAPERIPGLGDRLGPALGLYEQPRHIFYTEKFAETASGKVMRKESLVRASG